MQLIVIVEPGDAQYRPGAVEAVSGPFRRGAL